MPPQLALLNPTEQARYWKDDGRDTITIVYHIHANLVENFSDEIEQAGNTWNNISRLKLLRGNDMPNNYRQDTFDTLNTVSVDYISEADFDDVGVTRFFKDPADTTFVLAGDIVFDQRNFNLCNPFLNSAVHEFGHLLTLNHEKLETESVMFSGILEKPCPQYSRPQPKDINKLETKYRKKQLSRTPDK